MGFEKKVGRVEGGKLSWGNMGFEGGLEGERWSRGYGKWKGQVDGR